MIRRRLDAGLTSKVHETWTPPKPDSREGKAACGDRRSPFRAEDEFDRLAATAERKCDSLEDEFDRLAATAERKCDSWEKMI